MSEAIPRLNAALQGRYTVERELGEGGMATVYLARDVRHERPVALKVLRPELAAMIGADRFLGEIKTTANLQHPHILPLHDSGDADGFLFYVMPYVEGDTLRERLERERQLPVEEAIQIAKDVADALDYAHRQGVVHRDIKPANILLHEGRPQVADFGIALALTEAGGGRLTETGLSLGTPHYMSPEQAAGERSIDARSDVYALGCVLYEMLAGQPPFPGSSAQAVLARILTTDPAPVTAMRRTVPRNVAAALSKALEKLPADRFATAREMKEALVDPEFRHELVGVTGAHGIATGTTRPAGAARVRGEARVGRRALLATAAASVAVTVLVTTVLSALRPEPAATPAVFEIDDGGSSRDIEISPDGTAFATSVGSEGQRTLLVRRLDEADFRPVAGGVDPIYPSFSPDGGWLVYVETGEGGRQLMRVAVNGGSALTLVAVDSIQPYDPHWGDDGTIVFVSLGLGSGTYRVASVGGGAPERISELSGRNPFMLPDGSGALVSAEGGGIHVVDLRSDSFPSREIIPEGEDPSYVETGHVLYTLPGGGLFAVPFELGTHEVSGPSAPVLDDVRSVNLWKGYSVSRDGTLVFTRGGAEAASGRARARLLLADRDGGRDTLRLPERFIRHARLSPDGRRVAFLGFAGDDQQNARIFIYDMETSASPQLTFEGRSFNPVWSPDGSRIAFSGERRDGDLEADLYIKAVDGGTPEGRVVALMGDQSPTAWPTDDVLVFSSYVPGDDDIFTISPSGGGDPVPYLQADFRERALAVSPDGTLGAYMSNEAGPFDVYVRGFPEPVGQWRVSSNGGVAPRWAPDGRALYYWVPGSGRLGPHTLFEVTVRPGASPTFGVPEELLTGPYWVDSWDVHPDGRFLLTEWVDAEGGETEDDGEGVMRRLVILNWFEQLRELMGEGR